MTEFKIGDRVRVKLECAEGYRQPWSDRFKKGRTGTVINPDAHWGRVRVQWDYGSRGRDYDFQMYMIRSDLEVVK